MTVAIFSFMLSIGLGMAIYLLAITKTLMKINPFPSWQGTLLLTWLFTVIVAVVRYLAQPESMELEHFLSVFASWIGLAIGAFVHALHMESEPPPGT